MASANHIIVRDGAWIVKSSPPVMETTMLMVIIIGNSLLHVEGRFARICQSVHEH